MIRQNISIFALLLFALAGAGSINSQWSKLNTSGGIPHIKNASAVYDPSGNRMIVYGGRTATGVSSDIWSLNLTSNQWSQITPVGGPNPPGRYTQNAFYDLNSNSMIIWAGQGDAGSLMNDVWYFEFSSNQWHLLWPDGNVGGAPLKRYGTASVYEPVTRRITTFAGFTTSGRFEDTWTFDVPTMQWFDRTNTPHPPKRCLHSGVYANDLGKFVIYAGQDDNGLRDDIWQCSLSNYMWSDITPAVKPPARFWNSIIYYAGGNVLIFGGLGASAKNDMWKFRMGSNLWENINQGSNIPGARWGHTGIYIPGQDRMIIFGGEGDSLYSDTWQYDNVSVIGIEPVSNEIPGDFRLDQNYPNPFNPTTHFGFRIAEFGFVRLVIFDALGRQTEMLVNEELKAGIYEVDFDGSNLPSGVYFYQLESGSFEESRKMILLK
ncbi:MAG: kelch repeat-containing protein [Ignavibacteria bacterium]